MKSRVLQGGKKEIFFFFKYNRWSTFKARRSLDSGCPRDVDVAMSPEQTTIEGSPSSRVMEREWREGTESKEGRTSYTISYQPVSIRLLVPQRVRSHGRPFSREAHLFRSTLPPMYVTRGKFLPRGELRTCSFLICSRPSLKRHLDNFSYLFNPWILKLLLGTLSIVSQVIVSYRDY